MHRSVWYVRATCLKWPSSYGPPPRGIKPPGTGREGPKMVARPPTQQDRRQQRHRREHGGEHGGRDAESHARQHPDADQQQTEHRDDAPSPPTCPRPPSVRSSVNAVPFGGAGGRAYQRPLRRPAAGVDPRAGRPSAGGAGGGGAVARKIRPPSRENRGPAFSATTMPFGIPRVADETISVACASPVFQ